MEQERLNIFFVFSFKYLYKKWKKNNETYTHSYSVVHKRTDCICSLALESKSESPNKGCSQE